MELKKRFKYFGIVLIIIFLGLGSRRISFIPLATGDMLWASMIFFIVRALFLDQSSRRIAVKSILICWSVEFSQLYQADWINSLRSTLPGRLILGRGFLWTDLPAYAFGVCLAFILDRYLIGKKAND